MSDQTPENARNTAAPNCKPSSSTADGAPSPLGLVQENNPTPVPEEIAPPPPRSASPPSTGPAPINLMQLPNTVSPHTRTGSSSSSPASTTHGNQSQTNATTAGVPDRTPVQRNSFTESGRIAPSKTKCFIVHDSEMDAFERNRFSRAFDIETYKSATIRELISPNSTNLQNAINKYRPGSIVLHVGKEDIINRLRNNQPCQEALDQFKSLITKTLRTTPSKLCVSLLVPAPSLTNLNTRITDWNKNLGRFITELRKDPRLRSRIFTINHARLGEHTTTQTSEVSGLKSTLTEHGEKKLWLNLRDGLNRSTNLNPNLSRRHDNDS